ncbi:hypothetical protein [Sinorhizobium alkalisoli]|uniref:hypothetical protein n=1 Tax=Sinorhizobium alkalisoli TaxID=1752398 RepID=UPI00124CC911|nr:hypothetical protein [Sinorhizobium alkalisoli]
MSWVRTEQSRERRIRTCLTEACTSNQGKEHAHDENCRSLAAALLACASVATPAFAQDGNGSGNGNREGNGRGSENSAAESAPGHAKGEGESARDFAPGQVKGDDESAKTYAPGQTKRADDGDDDDTTGSVNNTNLGTLISTIRASKTDLSGIADDVEVTVVDVDEFAVNRTALDNAVEAREAEIAQLRQDLAELDFDDLTDDQIDAAVAVRVEADGTLTVFVD